MRFLHTSDWHLGRTFHGEPLLDEQAAFLDWLVEVAGERDVDAVLVSGDVYDRHSPPLAAVSLLDQALDGFVAAGIPVVMISGNHDAAVRLGFGRARSAAAGIHLRCSLDEVDQPVVLADAHGEVAVYGIPYLLPDAVHTELGVERSHHAVLGAATARIAADRERSAHPRSVVLAHAFVTGADTSDSERDIRCGGIGDAGAGVFDGVDYVALGHLHGPQQVKLAGSHTTIRYAGTPLAYSFSEKDHTKSVALVELDGDGSVEVELLPVPVPRPLSQVRGTLDELLTRADTDLAPLAYHWVKAILTDTRRPDSPMEQLRAVWPHTLVLEFAPEGALVDAETDLERLRVADDPLDVVSHFVEYVSGEAPLEVERSLLARTVEAAHAVEGAR